MLRPRRSVLEETDESRYYRNSNDSRNSCGCSSNCATRNTGRNRCSHEFEDETDELIDETLIEDCCNSFNSRSRGYSCNICDESYERNRDNDCGCKSDDCETSSNVQSLAMAYVIRHQFNAKKTFDCRTALQHGTMFTELHKPFRGGNSYE